MEGALAVAGAGGCPKLKVVFAAPPVLAPRLNILPDGG